MMVFFVVCVYFDSGVACIFLDPHPRHQHLHHHRDQLYCDLVPWQINRPGGEDDGDDNNCHHHHHHRHLIISFLAAWWWIDRLGLMSAEQEPLTTPHYSHREAGGLSSSSTLSYSC